MAVFTITPFIGPVLGPLISGFINQVCLTTAVGYDTGLTHVQEYNLEMDVPCTHWLGLRGMGYDPVCKSTYSCPLVLDLIFCIGCSRNISSCVNEDEG